MTTKEETSWSSGGEDACPWNPMLYDCIEKPCAVCPLDRDAARAQIDENLAAYADWNADQMSRRSVS